MTNDRRPAASEPAAAGCGGALPPSPYPARAAPRRPAGLARHRLSRLAGAVPGLVASGGSIRSAATSSPSRRSTTTGRSSANEIYRTIAVRTVVMAALVTLTDVVLAFPIAFYMARVASPRIARPARRLDPAAALVRLPRQGLRLAADPERRRRPQLAPRAVRPEGSRLQRRRGLARRVATSGCRT